MRPPSRYPSGLLAVLAAGLLACARPADRTDAATIDEDRFVAVMARLEELRRSPFPDSEPEVREARLDSARAALLEEQGVSAEQLMRFSDAVGGDPVRMQELAERVAATVDSMRDAAAAEGLAADSTAGAGTGVEAAGGDVAPGAAPGETPGTPPSRLRGQTRERLDSLRNARRKEPGGDPRP